MQSLYSFFSYNEKQVVSDAELSMLQHIEEVKELNLVILSLLVNLIEYADSFFQDGKKKHFPSSEDLNPNTRFINNKLVKDFLSDDLLSELDNLSTFWIANDHNVISKLFKTLYQSDLYKNYIINDDYSIDIDRKFFIKALNNYILNNELVHHVLEEKSIYWIDDLPFVATIIIGEFKSDMQFIRTSVFKDSSDKEFAIRLFRDTIKHNDQYEEIIMKFARNWDLDRIANMDQLLLKMAFAEILNMKELPVKVSMNEYIEISKYYSTAKSKVFLNGILDNAVKDLDKKGLIKKTGRGLI